MLIGKTGKFVLRPPFTVYSTLGLEGTIVGVNYINYLVAKGTSVRSIVYGPVDGVGLYPVDYSNNVIIVTIKASDGRKYDVPDIYIENLYDDSLNYIDAYITAKIGPLPKNYDYTYIRNQLASTLTQLSGINISADKILVSAQDNGSILDKAGASLLDLARSSNLIGADSDYGLLITEVKKNQIANDKIASLEKSIVGYLS